MPNQTIPVTNSERRILEVVKDELFPQIEDLKKVMVDLQSCRISWQVFSKRISKLEKDYSEVSGRFFGVVRKLETPDILFSGLEVEDVSNMSAYFNYQHAFKQNLSEGIGFVEIIDRTLDRKIGRINNNRTLWLAIVAIMISIYFTK